ncbi:hypothetical protein ACVGWT_16050, partial [Enterobacter hormaechei]
QCGAVWWAHPAPLPPGVGGKKKKTHHLARFLLTYAGFKTNKKQKHPTPQHQPSKPAVKQP